MPTSPSDPPARLADVLGTRVGFTCEGSREAPAVIMVHGVPGGALDFRYLAPLLATDCHVVRAELPGFGAARDAAWADYSPSGRARLVLALADHLGLSRFAVLGHSLGGPAAMATVSRQPARARALVLLASVGLRRHQGMIMPPPVARVLLTAARVPMLRDRLLRLGRATYERMRFPGAPELSLRELRIHAANVAGLSFSEVRRDARAIRCPTLIAWADDDRQIEPAIGQELRRAIRGADAVGYRSGGHNIQKTRAPELARRIREIVARALGPSSAI